MSKLTDFHIHTNLKPFDDGAETMTIPYIVSHAEKNNYKAIGISPHFSSHSNGSKLIKRLRDEISAVKTSIPLFIGAETNVVDCGRTLAIDPSDCDQLDYVIAAPDHFNWPDVEKPPRMSFADMIAYQHEKLMNLAAHENVDVISHPWIAFQMLLSEGHLTGYPPFQRLGDVPGSYFKDFAKQAAANNVAVEVTARLICEYPPVCPCPTDCLGDIAGFYHILVENGVMLSVNSDAHQPHQLNYVNKALLFLKRIGIQRFRMWYPEETFKSKPASRQKAGLLVRLRDFLS